MGADFVAFVRVDDAKAAVENLGALVGYTLPQLIVVKQKWCEEGFFSLGHLTPGWFDNTYEPPVRVEEQTASTNAELFIRTPEGFFITIGNHCVRIYHLLRWNTFLTDSSWQTPMIDACVGIANLCNASECVITSDYSPLNCSFSEGKTFDEVLQVEDEGDGEKHEIADLYQELQQDSDLAIKSDGGQRQEVGIWDSKGFWKVPSITTTKASQPLFRVDYSNEGQDAFEEMPRKSNDFGTLFPVSSKGRYGFIDKAGDVAISLQYDDAGPFLDGRAPVKVDGEWIYIDASGNRLGVSPGWPNKEWPRPHSAPGELIIVQRCLPNDQRYGYANRLSETLVIQTQYEDAREFSEGLAAVKSGGLWGFVDQNGTFVVEPQFLEVGDFHSGLAAVKNESGLWGYIDKGGGYKAECQFDSACDFVSGVGRICLVNKWGYVDSDGQWLWEPRS